MPHLGFLSVCSENELLQEKGQTILIQASASVPRSLSASCFSSDRPQSALLHGVIINDT